MWILLAFLSALFAGLTSILAKVGIKNTDSHVATAIRTVVIVIFAWLMVGVVGSFNTLKDLSMKSMIFLVLSGLTTGGSWICYFKALQLGDVNKVVPIDKSSTLLTMLLAFAFLGEPMGTTKLIGMIAIGIGTYLMIQKQKSVNLKQSEKPSGAWLIYALLSALFASMTAILGKVGIENVESNLGTAIRTVVVLIMAWAIVFGLKKTHELKKIDKRSWLFILMSGLTTGISWLFYYKALKDGIASIVVPIDKLSILVSIGFAFVFFKERLSTKTGIGLTLIVLGTLGLLIK